jgi:sigma-54 dependent transcriptional regulator, acetoin dehydrogenase operon transcriptional activator AcoR
MTASLGRTNTREPPPPRPDRAAPASALLILVLECDRPLAPSSRHALAGLDEVAVGRGPRRALRTGARLELGVPDGWMSNGHARFSCQLGRWVVEDLGSKNGVLVNGRPTELSVLDDGDLVELGHTLFLYREVAAQADALAGDLNADEMSPASPGLATFVTPLARAFADLARVAAAGIPVVIQGKSGTGKELVAQAVHALSGRAGPFVAVNCGALAPTLVESELFGYRKGAFSGATEDRPGLVRSAHGGTLFLDEVADLPAGNQAALLRVLQEREVTPVGAVRAIPVDLQLVAATQVELAELARSGEFREDLLARLSGFTIHMPPLAERREDLGILIGSLLRRVAPAAIDKLRFDGEAARALLHHDWPLNVRELERCLALAVALSAGELVRLEHLPPALRGEQPASTAAPAPAGPPLGDEDRRRRDDLVVLLREHGGNLSAVARASGKRRVQIQRWVKRYRLDPASFRR